MKISTRDLLWLTVVAALAIVLAINMFAFRQAKKEMRALHQQEKAKLKLKLNVAQATAAKAKAESLTAQKQAIDAKSQAFKNNVQLTNLKFQIEQLKNESSEK